MTQYFLDPQTRVWQRENAPSLSYSDGEEVEARLLRILQEAKNVSVNSPELAAAISDWPTEYHFSPERHNLLRPFEIPRDAKILELGCGCGAITRYLGERGARIVAVEGSLARARIAAERCRDLSNVEIYCDNVAHFLTQEKFDFVTLIGVLEYAPCFVDGHDPVGKLLALARQRLADNGKLIVAIENALGLKYFNGCTEDHTGVPYFGVNDLYCSGTAVTFGRRELEQRIKKAGFVSTRFFFPFPDYKLANLVLGEAALGDLQLNIHDLLIQNIGRDYPQSYHRAFAEELAWRPVIRNGLLPDLANSFLVFASAASASSAPLPWLAKAYSRYKRAPFYQVESSVEHNETGALVVRKRKIFPQVPGPASENWLTHVIADRPYVVGDLLIGRIHMAMARNAGLEEISACFVPWLRFLVEHSATDAEGNLTLPGDFVDCIPANIIEAFRGEIHYIDPEWVCRERIALAWVVIRGIFNSLSDCLENVAVRNLSYRQLATAIAGQVGISLSERDFAVADVNEFRLARTCFIHNSSAPRLRDYLDETPLLFARLLTSGVGLNQTLNWYRSELDRVKSTMSWRITKPLRGIWNLLRRIREMCFQSSAS